MEAAIQVENRVPTRLSASGIFNGFRLESERDIRAAGVETAPAIERMKEAWGKCHAFDTEKYYARILKKAGEFDYTPKDIGLFFQIMRERQGETRFSEHAGLFLSAFINECKGDDFDIHTAGLDRAVSLLGYRNRKNISIFGEVGEYVGCKMIGGTIIVNGDAGGMAGRCMENGSIIVKGDSGDCAGDQMDGGSITIEGDSEAPLGRYMHGGRIIVLGNAIAGRFSTEGIGKNMQGGEIHLERDFSMLGSGIVHGKIFHRGELIIDE